MNDSLIAQWTSSILNDTLQALSHLLNLIICKYSILSANRLLFLNDPIRYYIMFEVGNQFPLALWQQYFREESECSQVLYYIHYIDVLLNSAPSLVKLSSLLSQLLIFFVSATQTQIPQWIRQHTFKPKYEFGSRLNCIHNLLLNIGRL
jgi:hypothetical protein